MLFGLFRFENSRKKAFPFCSVKTDNAGHGEYDNDRMSKDSRGCTENIVNKPQKAVCTDEYAIYRGALLR